MALRQAQQAVVSGPLQDVSSPDVAGGLDLDDPVAEVSKTRRHAVHPLQHIGPSAEAQGPAQQRHVLDVRHAAPHQPQGAHEPVVLTTESLLDRACVRAVDHGSLMGPANVEQVLLKGIHRLLFLRRGVQLAPEMDGREEVVLDVGGQEQR